MSGHIVTLDKSIHQTVQELLPWFVTGTLEEDERVMVDEHIQVCTQCQSDIEWQRKLQAAEPVGDHAVPDVERAFARMEFRLDGLQRSSRTGKFSEFFQTLMRGEAPWMRWALAVQLAVIAGLAFSVVHPASDNAAYRTLGAPAVIASNVVVMFKPETTEQDLRRILQASGARIVDGPTVTGAYLLKVSGARLTWAVGKLRSEQEVVLAESLDARGGP